MIFQGSGNQAVADLTEGISKIQKSYNIIDLWWRFASRITWDNTWVCSATPSIVGQKPFWMCLSTKPFSSRNTKIRFRMTDARTLYRTGCRVIGLKFAGSAGSPFLYIRIDNPFFQQLGMDDVFQHSTIILWSIVRSIGQRFKIMQLIWSNGQLLALDLALNIARETSLYVGGVVSNGWAGVGNCSIQSGKMNSLCLNVWLSIERKYSTQDSTENEGKIFSTGLNSFLQVFQKCLWNWELTSSSLDSSLSVSFIFLCLSFFSNQSTHGLYFMAFLRVVLFETMQFLLQIFYRHLLIILISRNILILHCSVIRLEIIIYDSLEIPGEFINILDWRG